MDLEAVNPFRKVVNEEKYGDNAPHYPAAVLFAHLAMKGVQAGSIIGLALIPILNLARKTPMSASYHKVLPAATIIGGILVPLAPFAMRLTQDGIDDRGCRLEQNYPQLLVDKYSVAGAGAGAAAGALLRQGFFPGGSVGVAAGVGYYLLEKHGVVELGKQSVRQLTTGNSNKGGNDKE